MAAEVKGTAHIFGIGATVTNLTITGITAAHGFELDETVENADGVTVETRLDNRLKTLTLTARATSAFTDPALGSSVAISGLQAQFNDTYELINVGGTYATGSYVEIELTLRKYESVAVS
jgi:hypothetical protein